MKKHLLLGPIPSGGGGMFSTGDLLPQQSGSASIGVATNGLGKFTTNIKPYAHVHMNSGVFHDGQFGQSGVIRYCQGGSFALNGLVDAFPGGKHTAFEISLDGGLQFPLRFGVSSGLRMNTSANNTLSGVAIIDAPRGFGLGIRSSGILAVLTEGNIELRALGTDNVNLNAANKGNLTLFAASDASLTANTGTVTIGSVDVSIVANGTGNDVALGASNGANITLDVSAAGDITLDTDDGDIELTSGDIDGRGLGGQIELNAFASSGRLQYRFGPHQAWAQKLTHASVGGPANDGFWPIAHSGQMLEQIARRERAKSITIERPALNNDLTWFYTNQAITIQEVESVCRGSFDASGQFAIRHSTNRSLAGTELTTTAITCTSRTTGQITTSFASANIPADSWVWIAISGVSGVATTQLGVTIHFN